MRGAGFKLTLAALMLSATAAAAQSASTAKLAALPALATAPLEKGTLIVWFVETATPLEISSRRFSSA